MKTTFRRVLLKKREVFHRDIFERKESGIYRENWKIVLNAELDRFQYHFLELSDPQRPD